MHCPYCKKEIYTGSVPFLGQELEDLFAASGKRIVDLAEAAGVSYQMVHNWKSNKHRPSPKRLDSIAGFFGVNKTELLNGNWRSKYEATRS